MKSTLYRFVLILTALAVAVFALPEPVQAAVMSMDIVSVKVDDSVTIKANSFPANQTFTVRMDVAGKAAVDGIVVATTNSNAGGTFEATYKIPAELKGKSTIAIRMDSATGGYYVYNWFVNKTNTTTTPSQPSQNTNATVGPYVKVIAVEYNKKATLSISGFPASTDFKVRVGPFFTFSKDYEVVSTFNSGKGGSFELDITLPALVKDKDLLAVRLDSTSGSTHYFAYNAFNNQNLTRPSTSTPGTSVLTNACSVTSVLPVTAMPVRNDFDAIFTVKNTSDKNWEAAAVDLKFLSGAKMQKYADLYDLPKLVKPGESITLRVDMLAPDKAGVYVANWGLVSGSTTLCKMALGVVVK